MPISAAAENTKIIAIIKYEIKIFFNL